MHPLTSEQIVSIDQGQDLPENAQVLDRDVLLARCLGNHELVHRILLQLERALEDDHQHLLDACQRRDWNELAARAHRLKGTAANVGAQVLLGAVHQLETMARLGDQHGVEQALTTVELRVADVKAMIHDPAKS